MTKTPTLKSRVWNLLRTARGIGQSAVAVATIASVLSTDPEMVLATMMPEMMDGTIHCAEGPSFAPRSYPEG